MGKHWRRKWQPTPVFLPRESQGWGSLVGCRLWGRTESATTEAAWQQQHQQGKKHRFKHLLGTYEINSSLENEMNKVKELSSEWSKKTK